MSVTVAIDEVLDTMLLYNDVETGEIDPLELEGKPEKPKFEVTDKSSAEWVMRKIAKLQAKQQENLNIAEEQIDPLIQEINQVREWEYQERYKMNRQIEFLTSLLEPFHRKLLEVDPKAKTIKLPHGEMKIRSQQSEYQRDDKALVTSLKELGLKEYIKTEEKPEWGKLKPFTDTVKGKVVHKETGAVIGGITVVDKPDKFEVVVK